LFVYIIAIHCSNIKSFADVSNISFSNSSLFIGIILSVSFHFIFSIFFFQFVSITHFSVNCRDTEPGCHNVHQYLFIINFIFCAVLFVFDVRVLINKATHHGQYHSYSISCKSSHSSCHDHLSIALSIISLGTHQYLAFCNARSNDGFILGSAHFLAAICITFDKILYLLDLAASPDAFLAAMLCRRHIGN